MLEFLFLDLEKKRRRPVPALLSLFSNFSLIRLYYLCWAQSRSQKNIYRRIGPDRRFATAGGSKSRLAGDRAVAKNNVYRRSELPAAKITFPGVQKNKCRRCKNQK